MRPTVDSGRWTRIQAKIDTGYGKAARVLGQPFQVFRPVAGYEPLDDVASLGPLRADFTNAKASGFNYDKSVGFDDILWHALVRGQGLTNGDYFVGFDEAGDGATYFIAAMPPLKPIVCVLCNRTITLARNNSQVDADGGQAEGLPSQDGGPGRYWGVTRDPDDDTEGPGEFTTARNVPVALMSLAGASREQGNVPSDSAGPARWRAFLPQSVFPLGSVSTRDIVTDDEGERYQVSSAGWTNLGYRLELVRMEN